MDLESMLPKMSSHFAEPGSVSILDTPANLYMLLIWQFLCFDGF